MCICVCRFKKIAFNFILACKSRHNTQEGTISLKFILMKWKIAKASFSWEINHLCVFQSVWLFKSPMARNGMEMFLSLG